VFEVKAKVKLLGYEERTGDRGTFRAVTLFNTGDTLTNVWIADENVDVIQTMQKAQELAEFDVVLGIRSKANGGKSIQLVDAKPTAKVG